MSPLSLPNQLLSVLKKPADVPPVVLLTGPERSGAVDTIRALEGFHKFDVLEIGIEEPATVEATRDFIRLLLTRPLFGTFRLALIGNVDRLGAPAANTLLKTLEEPPDYARIVLIAHSARRVLPTIASRARTFILGRDDAQYDEWIGKIRAVLAEPLYKRMLLARALAAVPERAEIVATLGGRLLTASATRPKVLPLAEYCLEIAKRLATNAQPIVQLEALMVRLSLIRAQ